jgi:hypothetical protein
MNSSSFSNNEYLSSLENAYLKALVAYVNCDPDDALARLIELRDAHEALKGDGIVSVTTG